MTKQASRSVDGTGWIIIKVVIPSNTQAHERHIKKGKEISCSCFRHLCTRVLVRHVLHHSTVKQSSASRCLDCEWRKEKCFLYYTIHFYFLKQITGVFVCPNREFFCKNLSYNNLTKMLFLHHFFLFR